MDIMKEQKPVAPSWQWFEHFFFPCAKKKKHDYQKGWELWFLIGMVFWGFGWSFLVFDPLVFFIKLFHFHKHQSEELRSSKHLKYIYIYVFIYFIHTSPLYTKTLWIMFCLFPSPKNSLDFRFQPGEFPGTSWRLDWLKPISRRPRVPEMVDDPVKTIWNQNGKNRFFQKVTLGNLFFCGVFERFINLCRKVSFVGGWWVFVTWNLGST